MYIINICSQTYMFGVFPGTRPKKEVGYIMTAFGVADVLGIREKGEKEFLNMFLFLIGSLTAGYISDKIGRLPIIFVCAISMTAGSSIFYLQVRHSLLLFHLSAYLSVNVPL